MNGQLIELQPGRLTEFGRQHPLGIAMLELDGFERRASGLLTPDGKPVIAGGGSFSDFWEKAILEHSVGKASTTMPSFYLSLLTVVPEDSKVGTNITEANYTTWAKKKVEGTQWTASGTTPTAIKNNVELELAACTAGSSTIIAWAGTDNATLATGNVICWGTATSTVISTTQTPPKIAANGLEITLD